ncbi:MAG: Mur ligase family protein [Patescibacteria group bacterium]
MNNFERYYETIEFLEGLSNLPLKGDYMVRRGNLDAYLKKMRHFLELLGNPDHAYKIIHITGTSGKGSVTNILHEVLHASGKKVGSFTSPFVTTSIEKIRVGELFISPDELADIVDYLKPYIEQEYLHSPYGRPSYFEIFLAIALVYFQRQKCEWVVLEVGLGGRYDATNVIAPPVISAITNIDYDHTSILGKTLREIAHDKAGIIKKGSDFFTTENRSPLLKKFREICKNKKAIFHLVSSGKDYRKSNTDLVASIARHVGVSEGDIATGIKKASLPCRFEVVQKKPLVILDGAHNRAKMRSTVANLKNVSFDKLHLVIGMADNKDDQSILKEIIPLADSVYITRFQIKDRKCAHPKVLAKRCEKFLRKGVDVSTYLDSHQALSRALSQAKGNDLVLVTGSFFLAGDLRKRWVPEKTILTRRKSF